MVYYTAAALLCCAALAVFCLMIGENGRLNRKERSRIYVSCGVLFLSFLSEWSAIMLNGAPAWTTVPHIICKCLDYSLTPAAGLCVSYIVLDKDRMRGYMYALLGTNAFAEIVSAFTGHIYYVDGENYYHHGPAHIIYVFVFVIAIIYVIYTFAIYGRRFRKANPISLAAIMLLTGAGILIQEIIGGYVRTSCLSLSFGIILIFIHYTQYGLMEVDEHISRQQELLDTDALSGCLSRHAYEDRIAALTAQPLPKDLVIFSVDINDLKNVNDTLGHAAGDELITLSASCLTRTLGRSGGVYRTGGDEFVGILNVSAAKAAELLTSLREETAACRGKTVREVCLSCGYASAAGHPDADVKELFNLAEKMMYEDKAAFYRRTGRNRRSEGKDGSLTPGQVQRLLQNLLLEQYFKIMYAGFSDDSFTLITVDGQDREYFAKAAETGKLSATFAAFADSPLCYEGDRENFRNFVSGIPELLEANQFRPISLNYRRRFSPDASEFSDAELRVVPVSADPENLTAILFLSNLSEQSEARERERKTLIAAACTPDEAGIRRTILIIAYDTQDLERLKPELEKEYDILTARNSGEAREILAHRYDEVSAILLDTKKQNDDCREFLQARQGELLLRGIPTIVTARADASAEECSFEMGASDFVRKPCSPMVIRHHLHSLIALRESVNGLSAMETDELTGVFTRKAFFAYAENLIRRNPDARFDLILSDIQDFKHVNDQFGRRRSDEFLRFWAARLKSDNIEQRITARYGSDQFVMLVRNDQGFDSASVMRQERYEEMSTGSPIQDIVLKFGIYENVDHSLTIAEICDRAMLALQSVKGRYDQDAASFTPVMLDSLNRERMLLDNMERSLAANYFRVYYQAIHDAKTGALVGAEALSRWHHPEMGNISPTEFIPLFERNGFVTKLDYFVWRQVCSDLRAWLDDGLDAVPISVNVSRRDLFAPGFRENVLMIVKEKNIGHEMLHMEVTESLHAGGLESSMSLLKTFREDSFCVELDDFGTGYSSLNLLNRMPLDMIKLDMSFIRSLKTQAPVIRTMIALGHDLGCTIISEGVETEEQLAAMREMNCDYIQGYCFSKPLPRDEFTEYMKRCLKK